MRESSCSLSSVTHALLLLKNDDGKRIRMKEIKDGETKRCCQELKKRCRGHVHKQRGKKAGLGGKGVRAQP